MFVKCEFKLDMFVEVWSYDKWCILTARNSVPLVDHAAVKVWILALTKIDQVL